MRMTELSQTVSAFDLWSRVCDLLESLSREERFGFSCRELREQSFFEAASDGDPTVMRSSLAISFSGPFGLFWHLCLRVDSDKTVVSAEFVVSHYETQHEDSAEVLFQQVITEVNLVPESLRLASDILVDHFIHQVKSESLSTLWERRKVLNVQGESS
jgi:hypothetical protein